MTDLGFAFVTAVLLCIAGFGSTAVMCKVGARKIWAGICFLVGSILLIVAAGLPIVFMYLQSIAPEWLLDKDGASGALFITAIMLFMGLIVAAIGLIQFALSRFSK